MKVVSTAPHVKSFPSATGKDSVTIPPRIIVNVRDNFFLEDYLPEEIKIIEGSTTPVADEDKPEAMRNASKVTNSSSSKKDDK